MAWNISKTKRQALVKLQLRDKDGKFIEMGGGVKWYSSRLKKVVAGTVVGSKGENALVRLNKENPTHEPALVSVPAASIQAIDGKASLSPKDGPSADQTPEFEKPEAVADVEADPNAEAESDHESQLKGPQHLAANYGITETSDGNTYITRNDGESIYSPARALKVGDELISPAGADPTKPFSIGRGWATKGTERLNKDGEGPVIGKVIAISENRYAVVQMAGGHTIADRRNPEEQTDTVTVGLSNQVILATMGLKDALGDRVSSQTYADRPSDEEKEVAPDAPEAQSDHEGREVPEGMSEADLDATDAPAEDTAPVDPVEAEKSAKRLDLLTSTQAGTTVTNKADSSDQYTKDEAGSWVHDKTGESLDSQAMSDRIVADPAVKFQMVSPTVTQIDGPVLDEDTTPAIERVSDATKKSLAANHNIGYTAGDAAYEGFDGFNAKELEQLKAYTGSSVATNAALRKGGPLDEKMATTVAAIDQILDRSVLTTEAKAYRGVMADKAMLDAMLTEGGVYRDRAYTSTSADEKIGDVWFKGLQEQADLTPVIMDITMPAGFKAHKFDYNNVGPGFKHEQEVLLPRGTEFAISGYEEYTTESGVKGYRVHVTPVLDDKNNTKESNDRAGEDTGTVPSGEESAPEDTRTAPDGADGGQDEQVPDDSGTSGDTSGGPEPEPSEPASGPVSSTPVNDIVEGLAELEQAVEDVDGSGLDDEESEEILNGASFGVVGPDGTNYSVTAEKDENGDWNYVVADENGAEAASHVIGSDDNRVLAERIANPAGARKTEEAPAAEATPEAAPEATPEAPEAESYNENGLTEQEQRELASYTRLAARSYDQFKDAEGDRYKALADELLAKGEERKASAPAQAEEAAPESEAAPADAPITGPTDAEKIANAEKMYGTGSPQHLEAQRRFGPAEAEAPAPDEKPEKAPESAPEPEVAPESTPEESKPVEDAPAPSLVEPDAAPEEAPEGAPADQDYSGSARSLPVGSKIYSPDRIVEMSKVGQNQWTLDSRNGELIDDATVDGMVRRNQSVSGDTYKQSVPGSSSEPSQADPNEIPESVSDEGKPALNGEEGFVPIDGRGQKGKQDATPTEAPPAKPEPFGISIERRPDGLDHAVAARPEVMTPEEAEDFRKLDIDLFWAQHNNRSGHEAIARGKLADLGRRVQSRIDSELFSRKSGDDGSEDTTPAQTTEEDHPTPLPDEQIGEIRERLNAPAEEPEEAPEATPEVAPEPAPAAPVVDPNANEDGLLPDEAARLADLENRQAAAFRGETSEDPASFDGEISELIRHGRLRGRGREVGPFVARNPAPDPTPVEEAPVEEAPEASEAPAAEVPEAPAAPAPRRARGEVVPVADADGNMITRGDKIGHPTLGPVEITNTIPGSGRVEFIDPTTGRKKSVKAARVRKIDPNAAEAAPEEQPTTAAPGERFVDAATGKQGFGDANGNRVLVGDRIRHSNGSTGTVKSVYTAGNGGAWPAITWDSDGKVRRAMGNVLEKDDSEAPAVTPETAPEATPEPIEVVRPSTTPAPVPERVEPVEEPFEPVRPSATPAPAPDASPEAETHDEMMSRLQALVEATPVNGKISSDSQNFYRVSENQWQFNEGTLMTPTAVKNLMALGERRGEVYTIGEGGPAEVNDTPVVDYQPPATPEAALPSDPNADTPGRRAQLLNRLRSLPVGTKIESQGGEQIFTKEGDDDWSSNVDPGSVLNSEDISGLLMRGRERGLNYKSTTPATLEPVAPEAPTEVALTADSLVPPTVASRLEAFRLAPVGTTVTSPDGATTYTKAADDEWTSLDGVTVKNTSLAAATDSDEGHWIFNKTGPVEPEGINVTSMSLTDKLRAFRQAPLGSKLISTGGKVITKTAARVWTSDAGTDYSISDLAFVTAPAQVDISGPFGLILPETVTPANTLPTDRIERSRAIAALPIGTVITIGEFTFTKTRENNWDPTGYNEPHNDMDVAYAGSTSTPGTFVLPQPKPIPQDLESRIRVASEAPIGTVVTSSSGESFTKTSPTEWSDTATNSFHWGLGEFASKLKNNPYTGDYFVQGFHVPDIGPDVNADGSTTQPIPADEAAREALIESLPVGATVQHEAGRSFKRVGPNRWLDESTGYDEADFYVTSLIGRRGVNGAQGWTATTPPPEPEAPAVPVEIINSDLPVGTLLPSAEGSTSGLKRVGPDKWEMVKDGQPTGRFVTDETVKMFQELQGTTPTLPVDNRLGTPLGFSPEELNLPGGKSLGAFIQDGGNLANLSTAQTQAIQKGYDNFIENLNTLMPEGYSAQLDKPISFNYNGSMSTSVAFYHNGRKLTSQSYSTGAVGSNASRHFRVSTDSRTGKRVSSVEHALFELPKLHQGSGVSSAFLRASKQMYRQMGIDRVTIHADISVGGYAWARGGFDFKSAGYMDEALSDWQMRSQWNIPAGREAEWAEGLREFKALQAKATAAAFKNKTHPAPIAFANIGRPEGNPSADDTWFGKHMMLNSDWYGEFPLNPLG